MSGSLILLCLYVQLLYIPDCRLCFFKEPNFERQGQVHEATKYFLVSCCCGTNTYCCLMAMRRCLSLITFLGSMLAPLMWTIFSCSDGALFGSGVVLGVWRTVQKSIVTASASIVWWYLLGLAAGRVISLVVDGMPHWLLLSLIWSWTGLLA